MKPGKIEASLNKKLEKVEWGKYRIEEVLDWQKQKEIDPLKLEELKDKTENKYPFYGQATINNWIISYNQLINKVLNNKNWKPTILIHSNNQNIIYLETPFHLKDWHGATSVLQSEKLNRLNQVFIISSIDKVIKNKYSYNNKATKIELKNTIISLPTKNWKIDFDFMENFIEELEKEKIEKVDNYLKVSWLDNCVLTSEEKKVLEDFESGKFEWGEFKLWELFEINPTKYYKLKNEAIISENGKVPLVSNSSTDNWVMWFSNLEANNKWNTLTCSDTTLWADTMYYQRNDFIGYSHIQNLVPKFKWFNQSIASLIITSSRISTKNKYDYWNKFNRYAMNNTIIQLPIKNNQPDYGVMEILISAVQKVVVKDLVGYVNKK